MNYQRALVGGVVGGSVMTAGMAVLRALGTPANPEMMLGTMMLPAGGAAWVAGFMVHLTISALIALIYAWGFEHVTHRAGWTIGMTFALIHIGIGGVVMGMIPAIQPMVPEMMPAPGMFMSGMGAIAVTAFIVEHLAYGGIAGATYEPSRRPIVA